MVTTGQVCDELRDPAQAAYYARFIEAHFSVQSPGGRSVTEGELARLSDRLGAGEISVILLAARLKGRPILDDMAARKEAARLGLNVTGTLGLLHDAFFREWLSDSECLRCVETMRAAGFSIRHPSITETFLDYFRTFTKEK